MVYWSKIKDVKMVVPVITEIEAELHVVMVQEKIFRIGIMAPHILHLNLYIINLEIWTKMIYI